MRVTMLGTGAADGWPNPFCECDSCRAERRAGRSRRASSALVDDVLLIDCGPAAPLAASVAATSLRAIENVLITHGHPDHLDPAFLLTRHWALASEVLHVWGPPRALDLCRDWIAPDDPIELHPVATGDDVMLETAGGRYRVIVLPASHASGNGDQLAEEAVLYDITSPDGQRLVYATDTGPLTQHAVDLIPAPIDVLILDETFGAYTDHGTGHLDFDTFAQTVTTLRAARVVVDTTQVIATHFSHHNPAGPELDTRLRAIGARAATDLEVIHSPTERHVAQRLFILGGARSGKSTYAERTAALWSDDITYVATSGERRGDPEWATRVAEHQARRPDSWSTIETTDLVKVLASATPGAVLLIDCLTLWLTAVLDELNAWTRTDVDELQHEVTERVNALTLALTASRADVVLVSNEVGQGVVPETASGRLFRDLMGRTNTSVAQACTSSVFVVAGRTIPIESLELR